MNTLVQGYLAQTNDFQSNCRSTSMFPEENRVFRYKFKPGLGGFSLLGNNGSSHVVESSSEGAVSSEFSIPVNGSSPVDECSSEGESFKEVDDSDAVLKFISQMLMEEEDLENKPCMLHDCLALQATEKSLYDVLNNRLNEEAQSPNDRLLGINSSGSPSDISSFVESDWSPHGLGGFDPLVTPPPEVHFPPLHTLLPFGSSEEIQDAAYRQQDPSLGLFWTSNSLTDRQFDIDAQSSVREGKNFHVIFNDEYFGPESDPKQKKSDCSEMVERHGKGRSPSNTREKKNRCREDSDPVEERRSNKQLANNSGESEPLEMYDKVLLCSNSDLMMLPSGKADEGEGNKKLPQMEQPKGSNRGRPRGGRKQGIVKEVVDLRSLLMQCAQAVANFDSRNVNDLLARIKHHSSPQGDGTERLAHYFANALEARMAGTGTALYAAFSSIRISAAEILKAYKTFITACPFKKMSNFLANKTIKKLAARATTLHIIDFGILYGFQWPCLIQSLSERHGGPPKLRITGIDFPQPGFRPAERVEDTGRRLAKYCERFRVPFEYNAIAQKWETIKLEDLKIKKDELLVVNSLYRLHNVLDETVNVNSPRDDVLNLIKKINPDMFIHGVINGTYNTPFFITRFREALFHYSSMFDMFEAAITREDQNRLLFEEQIFGKDAMNIIACEGTERIDRPETYKQWQVRHVRAGFRQLLLDQEVVKYVRNKVKSAYHKDFSIDEDGKWMLQGWRGRVLHAVSYWQPA